MGGREKADNGAAFTGSRQKPTRPVIHHDISPTPTIHGTRMTRSVGPSKLPKVSIRRATAIRSTKAASSVQIHARASPRRRPSRHARTVAAAGRPQVSPMSPFATSSRSARIAGNRQPHDDGFPSGLGISSHGSSSRTTSHGPQNQRNIALTIPTTVNANAHRDASCVRRLRWINPATIRTTPAAAGADISQRATPKSSARASSSAARAVGRRSQALVTLRVWRRSSRANAPRERDHRMDRSRDFSSSLHGSQQANEPLGSETDRQCRDLSPSGGGGTIGAESAVLTSQVVRFTNESEVPSRLSQSYPIRIIPPPVLQK